MADLAPILALFGGVIVGAVLGWAGLWWAYRGVLSRPRRKRQRPDFLVRDHIRSRSDEP